MNAARTVARTDLTSMVAAIFDLDPMHVTAVRIAPRTVEVDVCPVDGDDLVDTFRYRVVES